LISVNVVGSRALEQKLVQVRKRARNELRSAMAVSADKLVDQMERLAPERTGELLNSIGWVWGEDIPKGAFTIGSLLGRNGNDFVITIFAGNEDAFYARWQEFGTVKMKASPFFFVSYRLQKRAIKSRMTRAINKAVKK